MDRASLVIMAAGIGSRYSNGIKQLEKVGPSGEIIMDYSIYDAIEAGFDKVVFIIRKDIAGEFQEAIGKRIGKKVKTEYVFQELTDLPDGFNVPKGRVKPWGTAHAVLCCRQPVSEPFLVINADDYYGKESFKRVFEHLASTKNDRQYCMAGFVLGNTLSDHGTVTRGVCQMDEQEMLIRAEETFAIKEKNGMASGQTREGKEILLPLDTLVSMNMWGFRPDFFDLLSEYFTIFLNGLKEEERIKAEYMLPSIVNSVLQNRTASVQVVKTADQWFGVTYQEDRQKVVEAIQKLIEEGKYPNSIV